MASIFIGSSGAMMDLSVDIAAAVNEVVTKRPDLSRFEAMMSGMRVGRAAMGTMTTTLLLAYSGSYIALLMVFMAQGTPMINVFNYKYVASEVIHTIVGSLRPRRRRAVDRRRIRAAAGKREKPRRRNPTNDRRIIALLTQKRHAGVFPRAYYFALSLF